jgi:hypothetical protein
MADRSTESPPIDVELIHRLRVAAEREVDVLPDETALHNWLAQEVNELAEWDARRAERGLPPEGIDDS